MESEGRWVEGQPTLENHRRWVWVSPALVVGSGLIGGVLLVLWGVWFIEALVISDRLEFGWEDAAEQARCESLNLLRLRLSLAASLSGLLMALSALVRGIDRVGWAMAGLFVNGGLFLMSLLGLRG